MLAFRGAVYALFVSGVCECERQRPGFGFGMCHDTHGRSHRHRLRPVCPCPVLFISSLPLNPPHILLLLNLFHNGQSYSYHIQNTPRLISHPLLLRQSRGSRKDSDLREFVRVTGATYVQLSIPIPLVCPKKNHTTNTICPSSREAKRYLDKHPRLDLALQSYMNSKENGSVSSASSSYSELEKVFNKYKGVQ